MDQQEKSSSSTFFFFVPGGQLQQGILQYMKEQDIE